MTEPWTQARELQLQRLQAGLASVDRSLFEGEIDPQLHQRITGDLHQQIAPLANQKEAFTQQQKQKSFQDAMQEAAQAQAIEQQNASIRAKGIMDRVGTVIDPLSGRTAHLVQDGKGMWKEIEFLDDHAREDRRNERLNALRPADEPAAD